MVSFIPSAQRARSKLFDEQLSTSVDVLSTHQVSSRLGVLAKIIIWDCEQAFLPNVRHGVARLPNEQVGSSNVAYLPLLRSDRALRRMRISKALAAPSFAMIDAIGEATGTAVIPRYLHDFEGKSRRIDTTIPNALTAALHLTVGEGDTQRVAVSRSVITVANYERGYAVLAETTAHEFQHAIDNRRLDLSPQILKKDVEWIRYKVAKEFRGYRVGHLVLDALEMEGITQTAMMDAWDEFNLDASAGWNVPDAAVERAKALGVL